MPDAAFPNLVPGVPSALSPLVEKASVQVVLDQEAPLRGSAYVAMTMA